MLEDELIQKNKKNNDIRNLLLFVTILFFIIFVIVFISSFRQYKNIQARIQNIYESINDDNLDFSNILSKYNEAENYFRLFTIDFDPHNYDLYEKKLKDLNSTVDSLINQYETDVLTGFDFISSIEKRKRLSEEFLILRLKVSTILDSSINLKDFPTEISTKQLRNKLDLKTSSSGSEIKSSQNYVVIEKKPFLKRLFGRQKDTIKFNETEKTILDRELILKSYESDMNAANSLANKRLKELQISFEDLRLKERKLLGNNFKLLYEINGIIRNIHDLKLAAKNETTLNEVQTLLEKSNVFKWQIISCLFFMFSMICIIVYYQFYTTYYERKLIEEKMYASKLATEKTDILAEITHEIRTPINSLIGIIDLLRKKNDVYDSKDLNLLESVYSNINNTSKTINDILNLSKLDQTTIPSFHNFNINDMMEEIMDAHSNQAKQKNIHLEYIKISQNDEVIYSDDFKIRQILTNLISNAIKYSDKGTVLTTILLDAQNNLIIEVQDEGIGISDALQDNIFRKYYTVNKSMKIEGGIGLGLFITRKMILSLDGKISFVSKRNKGTTFRVEIPIPKNKHSSIQPSTIKSINEFPKTLKWLIVDDNALNLLYMKQFFEESPNVISASHGLQALNIINEFPIDIVITDINMPIMTGDELLVEIRKNSAFDHIKVIATSSDNEQILELQKLHNLKFDGILIKPFNEKKLIDVIDYTLRKNEN
ncbi:hybrid sensor histidine kinase/response regulator [Sphingobacterium hungaricum]|uniref:histidine kinase n=1 Tax=Sphingobacterium hungaricum TaxID=2082723 RepID=A0A928YSM5_9SPHI|nr:ATP-binding protein [Sphingobacterium hungaricum]MBE8715440.1 hybrid sensor histidine kinase/response regulator [Sphingobacterium hungaricum]